MNEKEFDKRLYSPTHKMGFKILSDDQLVNIFPTVENMERKFEVHRKNISEMNGVKAHSMEFDFQYNLMYDSIFSIWGKRGSGKTSAIFTLKYQLEKKNKHDLFLPIIMPEMLPVNCDIIGWILAVLDSEVVKLENVIRDNIKLSDDEDFFRHCVFDPNNNKLRASYKKTKELASSRSIRSFGEDKSYAESIGFTERYTQNCYDFSRQLTNFWDTLVRSIKKAYGMSENEEPLIYIMFDDVDLTPDKVVELFSVIIKYLSHPNLIVITTADEELFRDVIESDLRKKIGQDTLSENLKKIAVAMLSQWETFHELTEYVQKETSLQKQVKETAELYIDKVLPPSERYYLELFDTCEKRRHFIENTNREGINRNIEQFISEQVSKLYKRVYGKEDRADNFLYYKNGTKKFFCLPYLLFMGNTSRQLTNQCFILQEMIDGIIGIYDASDTMKLKNRVEYLHREVYKQVHHFLYNSINSGNILQMENVSTAELAERILLFQKEEFPIYIDYLYILECYKMNYEKTMEKEKKVLGLKNAVALFMLAFFIENILLIGDNSDRKKYAINSERKTIHGIDNLIELFDTVTFPQNVSLLKRYDKKEEMSNLPMLMYLFEKVIIYPETIINFDVSNFGSIREYVYDLLSKEIPYKINIMTLEAWSHRNPIWFKTVSKILYLYFEGIYTTKRLDLYKLDLNIEKVGQDTFNQRYIKKINLNDGAHLLEIILMMGSKDDFIYRRFQNVANVIFEHSIKKLQKSSFDKFSFWGKKKGRSFVTAADIEEDFTEAIKEKYDISSIRIQYGNGLGERDIIASLGIKKLLLEDPNFRDQNDELSKLIKDIENNLSNNDSIKKWLTSVIYNLEEKIYESMKEGKNYLITDKVRFMESIKKMCSYEQAYGSRNIQDYKKITDIYEHKSDGYNNILWLENLSAIRLYQQINRTQKRILNSYNETVTSVGIISDMMECIDVIDKTLILAISGQEEYEWLENYVFMLYTLSYIMDFFYAFTFQEQKIRIKQRPNKQESFGSQIYQIMIPAVKSAVPENISGGKEKSAQYYLGNILRTYFVEAGDEYI